MKKRILTRLLSITLAFTILFSDISVYAASDVIEEGTSEQTLTEDVVEEKQETEENTEESAEEESAEEEPVKEEPAEDEPVVDDPVTEEEGEEDTTEETGTVPEDEVPVDREVDAVETEQHTIVEEIVEEEVESVYYFVPETETSAIAMGMYSLEDGNVSLKEGTAVDWIDRLDLTNAEEIKDFYDLLVEASDNDGIVDYLIDDSNFTTDKNLTVNEVTKTIEVSISDASNSEKVADEIYAVVGEQATAVFEKYYPYMIAARDAFDRDHPEVFWLSGETVLGYGCGYEYTKPASGDQTVTVNYTVRPFMVLKGTVDGKAFDIRATKYQSQDAIKKAISSVDSSCEKILSDVSTSNDYEKIKYFNELLTTTNEYNTSEDLDAIDHDCRECTSALEGKTGTEGPVCEGYARAFKVLCDKAGIPCVLVDGKARTGTSDVGSAHMWNYVQLGDNWYGVDVTWNDPVGKTGAISGYENENWLLVGSGTMVSGMTFADSHPVDNLVSLGGVNFTNGPILCTDQYAHQEDTIYKVTFHVNGGTINSGNITKYDKTLGITLPTDVTREGFIFDGWYESKTFEGEKVTEIPIGSTGNKTFYAKWKVIQTYADRILKDNGEPYTGYFKYDGKTYYANANGILQSGWIKVGSVWRYFDEKSSFSEIPCESSDGCLYVLENGDISYFSNKTTLVKNSWLTISGSRYYFDEDGFAVKGWYQDGSYWYYADDHGKMSVSATKEIEDHTYYFDSNYHLSTGWKKLNGFYRYFNVSGDHEKCHEITMDGTTGWVNLTDGRRSYIDPQAGPLTGWRTLQNYRYHFDSEGFVDTGFFQDGRYFYYAETADTATENSPIGNIVKGIKKIDGKFYGFHPSQYYRLTGWQTLDGERYFFQDDCSAVIGWYQEGNYWYYAEENGCMVKGATKISIQEDNEEQTEEHTYYFDSNYRLTTGWVKIDNQWRFFNKSDSYRNCFELKYSGYDGSASEWATFSDGQKSYIHVKNGVLKGWQTIEGQRYYFDSDGIMKTGMFQVGNSWYYAEPEDMIENGKKIPKGAVAKGIKVISGETYCFHPTSYYRLTGWQTIDGKRFFLGSDGKAVTGLFENGGRKYYAETASDASQGIVKGTVVTGKKKVGDITYVFHPSQYYMLTGWQTVNGQRYYLREDGSAVVNAWYQEGDYWYHADENGYMAKGLTEIETADGIKHQYFFDSNYRLSTGWKNIDGKMYFFDSVTEDPDSCCSLEYEKGTDGWVIIKADGRRSYINTRNQVLTGWQTIDGKRYYFDGTGIMETGLFQSGRYYYYAQVKENATQDSPEGSIATGAKTIGDKVYGFHPTQYYRLTGWQTLDGERYFFRDDCSAVIGWYREGNYWYYADENGCMVKGAQKISIQADSEEQTEEHTYYFDSNYRLTTGWVKIDNQWRFFNKSDNYRNCFELTYRGYDGSASEWATFSDGRKSYIHVKNGVLKGWQTIDGQRYYFDSDGIMATGMFQVGNSWYYAEPEDMIENGKTIPKGAVAKGIKVISGETYCFHPSSYYRLTGWQTIDGKRFFLGNDGKAVTGLFENGGRKYYAETASDAAQGIVKGTVVTGRKKVGDVTYVFHPSQYYMLTGWQTVDGQRYYLREDGRAVVNEWYQEGDYWYHADENGHMAKGLTEIQTADGIKHQYFFDSNYRLSTGWKNIDGKMYFFDSAAENPEACCEVSYEGQAGGWITLSDGRKSYINTRNQVLTGWQTIDGKRYYFDGTGIMETGWFQSGRYYYYAEVKKNDIDLPEGSIAKGAKNIDGKIYGFHPTQYYRLTGWQTLDGERYFFRDDCSAVTGWYQEGNYRYYADENGCMLKGAQKISVQADSEEQTEEHTYYFDSNYRLTTGWVKLDGKWRFFNNSDTAAKCYELQVTGYDGSISNWAVLSDGRRSYIHVRNGVLKGWQTIEGKRYYFDNAGILQTGWYKEGNYRYYADENGCEANRAKVIDGKTYYFDSNYRLTTGWVKLDGRWRFFNNAERSVDCYELEYTEENGWLTLNADGRKSYVNGSNSLLKGWQTIDGERYYFDGIGIMETDWFQVGNNWYYAEKKAADPKLQLTREGVVAKGVKTIDGKIYGFHPTQYYRLTGWQTINGERYFFRDDCSAVTGWYQEGDYWYHADENGRMAKGLTEIVVEDGKKQQYFFDNNYRLSTGWKNINGQMYFFDSVAEDPKSCCAVSYEGQAGGWITLSGGRKSYVNTRNQVLTGWQTIDGRRYYFDSTGIMETGWFQSGRYYYYAQVKETASSDSPEGSIATGAKTIDGKVYGFHPTQYYQLTGWQTLDGERYYFQDDCTAVKGWYREGNYWYYADEKGRMAKGAIKISIREDIEENTEKHTYYFDSNYRLTTGWVKIDNNWRFFDHKEDHLYCYELSYTKENGWLTLTEEAGRKSYVNGSNNLLKGWQTINGERYYFDNIGIMETGEFKVGNNWYYAEPVSTVENGKVIPQGALAKGIKVIGQDTYCFHPSGYYRLTGWQTINGKRFFLDSDGKAKTGLFQTGGKTYYGEEISDTEKNIVKGTVITGAREIDGIWHVFHGSQYYMLTGWQTVNGKRYYINENGSAVVNAWYQEGDYWYHAGADGAMANTPTTIDGKYYYFDSNYRLGTGWKNIGGTMYFFDLVAEKPEKCCSVEYTGKPGEWITLSDGRKSFMNTRNQVLTGWQTINGQRYYFDGMGILMTGDFQVGRYHYYAKTSGENIGALAKNTEVIDGKIYGFHPTQYYRLTGWQTLEGKRYYFQNDCSAVTGWYREGNYWYYAGSDGSMQKGEKEIDGRHYNFDNNYRLITGWQTISGQRYYFDGAGILQTGWFEVNDQWYYADADGKVQKDLVKITVGDEVRTYYFDSSYRLKTGWITVAGVRYHFNADEKPQNCYAVYSGSVTKGWFIFEGKTSYFNNSLNPLTGWQTIDGVRYYFNAAGVLQKGWFKVGNYWYYANSTGAIVNGVLKLTDGEETKTYYLDENYRLQTGWQTIEGKKYFIEISDTPENYSITYVGNVGSGWQTFGEGKIFYTDSYGNVKTGWQTIDKQRYYFDANGILQTGWFTLNGKTYYAEETTHDGIRIGTIAQGVKKITNTSKGAAGTETYVFHSSQYYMLTGFQSYGGHRYYLQSDGTAKTGWFTVGTDLYYGEADGTLVSGAKEIDGKTYFFHTSSNYRLTGWQSASGKRYYLQADGTAKTGWFTVGGKLYYGEPETVEGTLKGTLASGAKEIGGETYFFHTSSNYRLTGWQTAGTQRFYLNVDGTAKTGWFTLSGKTYYAEPVTRADGTLKGTIAKGLKSITETAGEREVTKTYYFHPSQYYMLTGWQTVSGQKYYFNTDGVMQIGWFEVGGYHYYADANGIVLKGLQEEIFHEASGQTKTYYFDTNYRLKTGWQTINGKRYFFENAAKPEDCYKTNEGSIIDAGWFELANGQICYADSNGNIKTGWQTIDRQRYYFDANGVLKTGWFTVSNKQYYGEPKVEDGKEQKIPVGVVAGGIKEIGGETYCFHTSQYYMLTGWQTVGGQRFYLDSTGVAKTGWFKVGNNTYYAEEETHEGIYQGAVAKGAKSIQKTADGREVTETYFFHTSQYYMLTGFQSYNGKRYYLQKDGTAKTGWFTVGTDLYYGEPSTTKDGILKGTLASGAKEIGGETYFFHTTSNYRLTGWQTVNGQRYYLNDNGIAKTGWFTVGGKIYYGEPVTEAGVLKGTLAKGAKEIDGEIYVFHPSSYYRLTGWQTVNGQRYYLNSDGTAKTGWFMVGNNTYYGEPKAENGQKQEIPVGTVAKGIKEISGKTYCFHPSGFYMLKGWQTVSGQRFYLDNDGVAETGWFKVGNYTYYAEEETHDGIYRGCVAKGAKSIHKTADGREVTETYFFHTSQYYMLTGFQSYNGKRYYLQKDGTAKTGWFTVGTDLYYGEPVGTEPGILKGTLASGAKEIEEKVGETTVKNTYFFHTSSNYRLTGWQTVNGQRYYLNEDGTAKTGWFTVGGKIYYGEPETEAGILKGTLAKGAKEIGGETYVFHTGSYYRLTGWQTANNQRFYLDANGKARTGWFTISGKTYYAETYAIANGTFKGTIAKGLKNIGRTEGGKTVTETYYFHPSQYYLLTGWQTISNQRYYFEADGVMKTGWFEVGGYHYYAKPDGTLVKGLVDLPYGDSGQSKTYYFDSSYRLKTGWQMISNKKYFFENARNPEECFATIASYEIKTGWVTLEKGQICYLNSRGAALTGWQTIDRQRYYFDANGVLQTGWFKVGNNTYYGEPKAENDRNQGIPVGVVAKGIKEISGKTYCFHPSSYYMLKGWQTVSGQRFYLDNEGVAKTGWFKVGNYTYYAEEATHEGIYRGCVAKGAKSIHKTADGRAVTETYFFHTSQYYMLTGFQSYNGKRYYLKKDGTARTGWFTVGTDLYYGEPVGTEPGILKGTLASGAKELEEKVGENTVKNTYFFHTSSNYRLTGWQTVNGQRYYLNEDGTAKTGWFTVGGKIYYGEPETEAGILKGTLAKGAKEIEEKVGENTVKNTYFFHTSSYYRLTGWQTVNNQRFYLDANGKARTGWFTISGKTYYAETSTTKDGFLRGTVARGLENIARTEGGKTVTETYYFHPSQYYMLIGWQTINRERYYFHTTGVMATGWFEEGGYYSYANPNGIIVKGLVDLPYGNSEEKKTYYFDGNYRLKTGWLTISGKKYFFTAADKPEDCFAAFEGSVSYGWMTMENGKICYADSRGNVKTGWQTISGQRYYFDANGVLQTGWFRVGNSDYYGEPKVTAGKEQSIPVGAVAKGIKVIDGETYCFHTSQYYMLKGWQTMNGQRFYLDNDGAAKTGWFKVGNYTYYAEEETHNGIYQGTVARGAKSIHKTADGRKVTETYFFHTSQYYMLTGFQSYDGKRYYLQKDGTAKTGWFTVGTDLYYGEPSTTEDGILKGTLASGAKEIEEKVGENTVLNTYFFHTSSNYRLTGWQTANGQRYYLGSDGAAKTGWFVMSGKYYYGEVESQGKTLKGSLAKGAKEINKDTYVFHANDYYRLTGWQTAGGQRFYLQADGKARSGWFKQNGCWYYGEQNEAAGILKGTIATGLKKIVVGEGDEAVERTYYFDGSYRLSFGWKTIGNIRYFFNVDEDPLNCYMVYSGSASSGWFTFEDGRKSYFNSQGNALTGWQTISGKKYYFDTYGIMQTGWCTINGEEYFFNADGIYIPMTAPAFASVTSTAYRTVDVKWNRVDGVQSYTLEYSKDSVFPSWETTSILFADTVVNEYRIENLEPDTTYYFRLKYTAWAGTDENPEVHYSQYSAVKSVVVRGEVAATSTSAEISDCQILSGSRNGGITVQLKASLKDRIKSADDRYYIVETESYGNAIDLAEPVGSVDKAFDIDAEVVIDGGEGSDSVRDCVNRALMNKFALAILKDDGTYQVISTPMGITNPEFISERTTPILKPISKKGLQGVGFDDAADTNSKNTLFNLDLAQVVGSGPTEGYVEYVYKGKTYYFSECSNLVGEFRRMEKGFDQYVQEKTGEKTKICVTLNLLLSYKSSNAYLIDPAARTPGHRYYTLNVREEKSRETLEAVFFYLGELFGHGSYYVTHWVLGNEVNSSRAWNYQGSLSFDAYMQSYATAFRLLYNGVKAAKTGNNVYISLDNGWTAAPDTYAGKSTLDKFASYAQKENPDMLWSIAYHGYSYPLTKCDFWNDNSNTTNSLSTRYISMKNIYVLTDYAVALEQKYNKPSGSIRVILSEQGYNAGQGHYVQAQALARGYYMAEFNDRIDAFIIRAIVDDRDEMSGGLYLGLQNIYQDKRISFYTYEYMDSSLESMRSKEPNKIVSSENISKFKNAQTILCDTNWESIIPNFSRSKLEGMY